jgi:hypothetical protein
VAIVPKGTGAFSLAVANNAAAGGNKRGTYAVDLQLIRSAATQIASGTYSFAAGNSNTASGNYSFAAGNTNTASGDYSTALGSLNTASGAPSFATGAGSTASANYAIAMGQANTADGSQSSVIGGTYGTARTITGNRVYPAAFGTTLGARQFTNLVVGQDTTDATASRMTSDGNVNIATTNTIVPANNSAVYFKGTIVAGVTSGGNSKVWDVAGLIKRGGSPGSTAFVGTPTITSAFADAGASTWTIAFSVDLIVGGMNILATGQAATNIRWVGNFQVTEMTY